MVVNTGYPLDIQRLVLRITTENLAPSETEVSEWQCVFVLSLLGHRSIIMIAAIWSIFPIHSCSTTVIFAHYTDQTLQNPPFFIPIFLVDVYENSLPIRDISLCSTVLKHYFG